MREPYDCIVVGAGPAGLTAALYLARYRRSVLVVHDGTSRALRIPRTHNVPGFPGGVRGRTLISRMERQAKIYGAEIRRLKVDHVREHEKDGFQILSAEGRLTARTVIAATGVRMNQPDLPDDAHEAAMRAGVLRYCPICDGYEARDRRIAVLGSDHRGAAEALFLRQYTTSVALIAVRALDLTPHDRRRLDEARIEVIESPVAQLTPSDVAMEVAFEDGETRSFDVLYPALGCAPRTALLEALDPPSDQDGAIITAKNQAVRPDGLFVAGDVVEALDQISVAIGHGAIAATHAHRRLRRLDGDAIE
ncbi:MAG: NAD(P)/FAD-dependent oxidoreductase [Pseudomonadota bacterium]